MPDWLHVQLIRTKCELLFAVGFMTLSPVSQRGRKARIGKVCFDAHGRIRFFAGYGYCLHCGANSKILLDINEAREFGRQFGAGAREPIGARVARRLARQYNLK